MSISFENSMTKENLMRPLLEKARPETAILWLLPRQKRKALE